MTLGPDDWSPTPELLAAYFDGELAGRPHLEALRGQVEDWLRRHPEAREVLADYRRLAQLWQATSPPEPRPAAWRRLQTLRTPTRRRPVVRWIAGLLATAAGIALVVWLGLGQRTAPNGGQAKIERPAPVVPPEEVEVFAVATAAEVVILRVEGADTQTLVVGEPPLHGPMELAGPGEVALTSVRPAARDQMMPHVRMGGKHRPLIWARVDPEEMEP